MNINQKGSGVEIRRYAVGANAAQTCTGLQTKPVCSKLYSADNANLLKFGGIYRYGAHVALILGGHEHETKGMGSSNMETRSQCKRYPNLYGTVNQASLLRAV